MSELREQLAAVFIQEAREALPRLAQRMVELEREAGDALSAHVAEVFRIAHSLKGAAATVQREDLARLAHHLESALEDVRQAAKAPGRPLVDAALAAVDLFGAGLQTALPEGALEEACARLDAAAHLHGPATPAALEGKARPRGAATTAARVDRLVTAIAGAARGRATAWAQAARHARRLASTSPAGSVLARLGAALAGALEPGPRAPQGLERIRAAQQAVDALLAEADGTGATAEEVEWLLDALGAPPPTAAALAAAPAGAGNASRASFTATAASPREAPELEASIRIPVALLDAILYRLDELIAVRLRTEYHLQQLEDSQRALDGGLDREALRRRLEGVREGLAGDVRTVGVLTHALQDDLRDVRMVPVAQLLSPFVRIGRDLGRALGKDVQVALDGEAVRVDKRLLEVMRDPLTHLVRNAIDHGLEPSAEREAQGKPPLGELRLRAEAREGNVLLEVSDDGRGIDPARLRAEGVRRGLVSPEDAAALNDGQAQQLVFRPGFSTAETISETSGRGVGLDIVRDSVRKLGGRIELRSEPGRGTTFSVLAPLTLSAARGLVFRGGARTWCLPLSAVEEVVAVEPQRLGDAHGSAVLEVRGQAVAFRRVDDLFAGVAMDRAVPPVAILVAVSEHRVAIGVDEIVGEQEIVVKGVLGDGARIPMVAGATHLADGRLVTVVDPAALVDAAARGAHRAAPRDDRISVLVVDDSLTSRMLLSSVLENEGYRTLQAADGDAALALLSRHQVHLVVSDVEMPGIDGFELVRRVRADPSTAHLPVVLVTSLVRAEERMRGLAVGANAYLVKRDFDAAAFVAMVGDFVGPARAQA